MFRPLTILSLVALSVAARADDPPFYVRAEEAVIGNPAGDNRRDTLFQAVGPVSGEAAVATSTYGTDLHGSYDTSADYGTLTGAFDIHSRNSASSGAFLTAGNQGGTQPNAEFADRLTIVSATLAAGTPVTVRLGGLLGGTYATATSGNPSGLGADARIDATYAWFGSSSQGTLPYSVGASGSSSFSTADVIVKVGDTLDIHGRLFMVGDATTNSYGDVANASSTADGRFLASVSVLDPNASYTALSGRRYAGAVPEPSCLLALAPAALALMRRRRA